MKMEDNLNIPLNSENDYKEILLVKNDNLSQRLHKYDHVDKEKSWIFRMTHTNSLTLLKYMRYINVILALFQAITGFMGLFDIALLNITSFLIAVYVIIFALVLLVFECRFSSMESTMRLNYGFLFTLRGRAAFIFFIAFLDFGMSDTLAWVAGVLMLCNATFNVFIILCHPEFRSGHLYADTDPTSYYTAGEQETKEFFKKNQNIMVQTRDFAMNHVRENPELIKHISFKNAGYVPPLHR